MRMALIFQGGLEAPSAHSLCTLKSVLDHKYIYTFLVVVHVPVLVIEHSTAKGELVCTNMSLCEITE